MADKIQIDPLGIAEDVLALTQLGASLAAGSREAAIIQLATRIGLQGIAAVRKLTESGVSLDDFRVPATLDEHVAEVLARRGIG